MKRLVPLLILGVIVVAGVIALLSAVFRAPEVQTVVVRKGPARETVYATGYVEARERRVLRAARAAVVERIFSRADGTGPLRDGDEVRVGMPLVLLRDSARQARQAAAEAELKRVSAQLAPDSPWRKANEARVTEARQTSEDDRAREQRYAAQLDKGGLSQDQYDAARTRAQVSEDRLRSLSEDYRQLVANLEAQLTTAASTLEQVRAQEQDDTIRAPLDGVLLRLPLKEGELASAGAELAMVGDVRELIIEAEVNEDDIGRVRVGQAALVRLAGSVATRVRAKVYEILPDANRVTKGFTIRLRFEGAQFMARPGAAFAGETLLQEGGPLYSGLTAELGVVVAEVASVLVFPRAALTANNSVFVVDEDAGTVTETKVELGLMDFSECEARGGLREGQRVVVGDIRNLSDKARIKLKKE